MIQAGKCPFVASSVIEEANRTRALRYLPRFNRNKVNLHSWRLRIEGDVLQPTTMTLGGIKKLPLVSLTEDFRCVEGWVVKDVIWQGVAVSSIIQRENLKPHAKFLLFCSGKYTAALSLKKAFKKNTILAFKKSKRPLGDYHGGPLRLVFEGHDCYESVKSVDRIVAVSRSRAVGTAKEIAISRLQR
jgi:DMSO/TMAO reductase YedYZ molybdopterin-dependent catalytic subunit